MTWIPDGTLQHLRDLFHCPEVVGGRYELRQLLGEGGMGQVFLAHDRELDRSVAVKVLKETLGDADAAERMLREARIIARLEHPGIVAVHDVGRLPDGRMFYVMKCVRGVRLDAYFKVAKPLADRLRVFERICETVAFAHAHGVIHRDLKPQNVMVGEFGEVLVLDWGVAKILPQQSSAELSIPEAPVRLANGASLQTEGDNSDRTRTAVTAHGTILGTPAYMPPEQALGDLDRVDARSDVFSLGAILFFLLTGRAPIASTNIHRTIVSDFRVESARQVNRVVPKAVNAVCAKAMSFDASDRYASARALADEVGRFLSDQRVWAHREGILEKVVRIGSANRALLALVAAYLAMRSLMILLNRV